MQRLNVDHRAGRHGRDAVLADDQGNVFLRLAADWAVTNDEGRTTLFIAPDLGSIAVASAVSGLIDEIVGGIFGGSTAGPTYSRNQGPGRQTVKRARVPIRGVPVRWTPVATVAREPGRPGEPAGYRVEAHEDALPPVVFAQRLDGTALAGLANGFGDAREGIFDLEHVDGRPILRHWATIDAERHLVRSVFDVEDEAFPLGEAVIICLARFACWRD